jgi:glycerophosphoryl diester phosphodiesterase
MLKRLQKISLWFLGVLILLLLGLNIFANPIPEHPFFKQFNQYPLVIAHAGSELYPTDTLFALQRYAEMDVDVLEMDIHMTQDGVIVLLHDHTVDRTTDGSGDIREMTFAQTQSLDAGYNWTEDGETFPYRGIGITIPALEEVFQTFPGYPMIIEIKQSEPSLSKPFCELIKEYRMEQSVIVPSFRTEAMDEFRQVCPGVATAASEDEVRDFVIRNFLFLSTTVDLNYVALQVPESRDNIPVVTPWLLWAAQRRNLQVHIWTINQPDDMLRFIDMGVDGIMTDRTDLLIDLLGR